MSIPIPRGSRIELLSFTVTGREWARTFVGPPPLRFTVYGRDFEADHVESEPTADGYRLTFRGVRLVDEP